MCFAVDWNKVDSYLAWFESILIQILQATEWIFHTWNSIWYYDMASIGVYNRVLIHKYLVRVGFGARKRVGQKKKKWGWDERGMDYWYYSFTQTKYKNLKNRMHINICSSTVFFMYLPSLDMNVFISIWKYSLDRERWAQFLENSKQMSVVDSSERKHYDFSEEAALVYKTSYNKYLIIQSTWILKFSWKRNMYSQYELM